MPLNLDKLQNWPVTETVHHYDHKDTILYALGVGLGASPADPGQLKFVYESGLKALPTMAMVLGAGFPWLRDPQTGINLKRMLHGESRLLMHGALPVAGAVVGRVSISGVADRGPDKGAALYFRHDVHRAEDDALLAVASGCFILRDGGGCGSTDFTPPSPHAVPDRAPDEAVDTPTLPQSGLIYRLSGDRNPLHADPAAARAAGFDRPILHGACTYGMVGQVLLARLCDFDPARLRRLDVRYSAPLYPGETLHTEIWRERKGACAFRCTALERGVVVLNNGYAEFDGE